MAPSCAYVTAPKNENTPPTIQAKSTSLAEPAACIISAGTRKMPLPITTPMTIEAAWLAPSSRRREGVLVVLAVAMWMGVYRGLDQERVGVRELRQLIR